jgi:hypothetical protein
MNVLSTTTSIPFSLHILATAPISVTFKVGFVGDSIQTILVFGLMAALTFSKS